MQQPRSDSKRKMPKHVVQGRHCSTCHLLQLADMSRAWLYKWQPALSLLPHAILSLPRGSRQSTISLVSTPLASCSSMGWAPPCTSPPGLWRSCSLSTESHSLTVAATSNFFLPLLSMATRRELPFLLASAQGASQQPWCLHLPAPGLPLQCAPLQAWRQLLLPLLHARRSRSSLGARRHPCSPLGRGLLCSCAGVPAGALPWPDRP